MVIVLVILALIVILLIYLAFQSYYGSQKHQQKMLAVEEAYKRMVKRHQLKILEVSRLPSRLIAIDRVNGKLLMVIYKDGITWERCVDLGAIKSCELVKTTDHESGYIQHVHMELLLHNSSEVIRFPFFDQEVDDVRELRQRTNKSHYWQRKIRYYLDVPESGPRRFTYTG
jgi:hypothetical protein